MLDFTQRHFSIWQSATFLMVLRGVSIRSVALDSFLPAYGLSVDYISYQTTPDLIGFSL